MGSSTPAPATIQPPAAPRRRPRRRVTALLGFVIILALVAVGGYLAVGAAAYDDLGTLSPDCGGRYLGQDPSNVEARTSDGKVHFDATDLRFSDFTGIAFPSRDARPLTIRAWYAPGPAGTDDPVVILVHGKGSCRRDPVVLLPAGMLHRAGFGVLMLDLRDHGASDYEDGRWAGGVEEYLDVLGAWDWLVEQGYPEGQIGLFGTSLGAATATIAMGEEPRVAATWADSSYSDSGRAATEYAESEGWPGWVAGAGLFVGRIVSGDDLGSLSPDDELTRLAGRPYAITQGDQDETVLVHNAFDNAAIATAAGTPVEPWIIAGAGHVKGIYLEPEEYATRLVSFFDGALGTPGG
jgi:dipeptidyl aminopeptidase/acylaminoacyl peptidase